MNPKKKSKRQYTKPVFQALQAKDTGLQIDLITNKSKGKPFDVIKVTMRLTGGNKIDFKCSPDEAIELGWGILKATWHFLHKFEPYKIFRSRGAEKKWSKKKIWWSL